MSDPGSAPTGLKRVVVASMAGTVVEWYEFFLYGTAATLVFNKVFFPAATSATSTGARSSCNSPFCLSVS